MSEEPDPVVTESRLTSALKSALNDVEKRLKTRITEEGKTTRRHFDVMVEKVNDSVRLVAEVTRSPLHGSRRPRSPPAENRQTLTARSNLHGIVFRLKAEATGLAGGRKLQDW
jgi:hypothetical protein